MGRRLPHTPASIIRSACRRMWLRSRERAAALKATGNCCSVCGVKASRAKGREVVIDVHHRRPPNWERIFSVIREELLVDPKELKPLCECCHDEHHARTGDNDEQTACN